MNEEQNVNTNPKPKKKRSFWWLKLLFILILVAAGVIGGIMLSSQEYTQKILGELFPQLAVSSIEAPAPVETLAPSVVEKPIEFTTPTPAPKPSKAPLEIVSPKAEEKAEPEETAEPEGSAAPEEKAEVEEPAVAPSATPAPEESAKPEVLPAFAPVTETPAPVESAPAAKDGFIGIDAALEAALKHAKLSENDVIVYGVSREKDDGNYYYEVEFLYNNLEYEYEINARTGVVEGWKIDREKSLAPAAAAAPVKEAAAETSYVSLEDAKQTALFHAGYKEHETTDMEASLKIDNNKVVYEIEFWAEGYDYNYKLDAESGLVIMVEKERG